MLSHQLDHVRHQALFICAPPWLASLCRSVLAKYLTDPTLRYLQLATHMINADPTTRGA
jgi:hypothetical protein